MYFSVSHPLSRLYTTGVYCVTEYYCNLKEKLKVVTFSKVHNVINVHNMNRPLIVIVSVHE